ncbi:MAG: hypothetical protein HFI09_01435 [Bacilli bacterium]|nr:hypothetical protein [Bacilli bacterium]
MITEAIYRAKVGNNNIVIGACGEHTNYIENLEFLNSVGMQYISVSPSIIPLLQDRLNEIEHGRTLKREFDFD